MIIELISSKYNLANDSEFQRLMTYIPKLCRNGNISQLQKIRDQINQKATLFAGAILKRAKDVFVKVNQYIEKYNKEKSGPLPSASLEVKAKENKVLVMSEEQQFDSEVGIGKRESYLHRQVSEKTKTGEDNFSGCISVFYGTS